MAAAVGIAFGFEYAAAAVLALAAGFWAIDYARGRRLLAALRGNSLNALPTQSGGLWGELARRVGRLLGERDERLRGTEARLQEFLVALENSPNGVVLLDDNGRIEWCNQTAARQFGFDTVRDRLQNIGNLVRDPVFAAYMASWNYSREVVLTIARPGAAPLKLSVQVHPYAGNRRLLLGRDVTAVEQAEAMRRDFVANVSHEIRTPLAVLSGFVETLQNIPLDGQERARYLGLMAQQAQRMQALVNDLLTLSRLEGSPPPGTTDWIPVQRLLAQCEQEASSLSSILTAGAPQQVVARPAPPLELSGSASELQSAMSNLVSNAVRYTPPGGRIELAWDTRPGGSAEFSVRDSGPGIPPEHIARLTERFYRVDSSRSRETGGTGLGLAIVKHVAQRHGAELKIDSTPGRGSRFALLFPPGRVRAAAAAAPTATSSPSAAA
jgi:two-component system phosphate regulon sensor histidine kinase PhoR